jgi:hypothetical protein
MESKTVKPVKTKCKIALVQGESFRCVAVEAGQGMWKRVADGALLPRVLEIVSLVGYGEPSFLQTSVLS